jgi:hypothetical protein
MIARTLSKLYPAPIALRQHDLMGTSAKRFTTADSFARRAKVHRNLERFSRRADCSPLSFNAVGYVSRHRDRVKHFVFGVALDDGKGHLDI